MAGKFGSASIWFLVDGWNIIATKLKGLGYKLQAQHESTTGLGDTVKNTAPTGLTEVTIKQDGAFFDTTTTTGHAALKDVVTSPQATPRIICAGFAGNTISEPFVGFEGAYDTSYETIGQVGALTKANSVHTVSGQADHGVILHALEAETADENGASVDNAASSNDGGFAYIQVTAFSGFSGAVVTVEHSADDSAWATLATFTTVTTAPTAARVVVAAGTTVNRYLRYVLDVTGSGSITLLVGFARRPSTV